MLNVQGPASRALLQALSHGRFLRTPAFPFATCREVRIGYQTALAIRLTYVGELGWELYIPTSFAQSVYDQLDRGRQDARTAPLRLPHAQLAADREGLSRLAARHRTGGYPARGRPGIHLRLEQTRRIHRSRGARRSTRCRTCRSGAWCSSCLEDPRAPDVSQRADLSGRRARRLRHLGHVRPYSRCRRCARLRRGTGRAAASKYVTTGRYEIELRARQVGARASLAPLYDPKNLRIRA